MDLSAILVVGDRRDRAARALASLLEQPLDEVIVVDVAAVGHPPLPRTADPRVRTLELDRALHLGRLRAAAVRAARGRHVAFLEEHARALPGWAAALGESLAGEWSGVTGQPVFPGTGRVRDAASFWGFLDYLPPISSGEVARLIPFNSAFRREALLELGAELERCLLLDLPLYPRLRAAGHRLFLDTRARFEHANEATLAALLASNFEFSRLLGADRTARGVPRKVLFLAAAPLLPALRTLRVARAARRLTPVERRRCLGTLPVVFLAAAAAVAGQALGLAAGGDPLRLTRCELEAER